MDNFKQAVTELTGQEDQAGEGAAATGFPPDEAGDGFVETLGEAAVAPGGDSGEGGSASGSDYGARFSQTLDRAVSKAPAANSSGTVIAPGTVVDGNISSNEDLLIYGVVNGDVLNANKLIIHGEVAGSINAKDISLVDSIIAGNVIAQNSTEMTKDSCILGDLTTQNVVVSGKVKGNIEAKGNGIFKKDSIVLGNISVGTIVIEGGAKMRGFVTTTDGDKEVDEDLFPQK
ncbi:MAG: polymer-forming cytoskeletal protein [Clostridiales bacterium]|nr:polymer-forming cytoskeletal protein [Clostridiales bacterium]